MFGDAYGLLRQYRPGRRFDHIASVQHRLYVRALHVANDRGMETLIMSQEF